MAQINAAWYVLSDPARRAVYDAQARGGAPRSGSAAGGPGSSASATAVRATPTPQRLASAPQPARFPWRFMLLMAALGIGFVLVNAAITKPGKEPPVDHMLNVGSCVAILPNGDATEVQCGAPHDGVVTEMLPANSVCDGGAELRHDHQGLGDVCVQRSSTG